MGARGRKERGPHEMRPLQLGRSRPAGALRWRAQLSLVLSEARIALNRVRDWGAAAPAGAMGWRGCKYLQPVPSPQL